MRMPRSPADESRWRSFARTSAITIGPRLKGVVGRNLSTAGREHAGGGFATAHTGRVPAAGQRSRPGTARMNSAPRLRAQVASSTWRSW
jgi:hypothetical protein